MDKAKINAIVKQIKAIRSDEKDAKESSGSKLNVQVSSKPEKLMIGAGLAAGLAILFDDSRKRKKRPEKARPFYKRFADNYRKIDSLLDSTIAKDLKKQSEREFHDDKLENMQIEKGIDFDI